MVHMCLDNLLLNFGVCRLTTNQCILWWYMCGITMETRFKGYIHIVQMFQFHTPVCLCLHARLYVGRYALKPHVVSKVYWVLAQFALDGILWASQVIKCVSPGWWCWQWHLPGGVSSPHWDDLERMPQSEE